ncbi:hypothetical protein AMJ85_11000 [candidate division BRC1 bacterium SM23_51]|nr:MAG: hypothetical protein AMJ85_11000 [candidate division BRC1 bacterium SM23_51]
MSTKTLIFSQAQFLERPAREIAEVAKAPPETAYRETTIEDGIGPCFRKWPGQRRSVCGTLDSMDEPVGREGLRVEWRRWFGAAVLLLKASTKGAS